MPSVEELLSVAEDDANTRSTMDSRIEIDADTRIIQMMPQDELFGVESDEKSERKYFKVPKIVGNGVDLSKLQLRINYQNASKIPSGKDMYIVKDATVYNDEWVYFSWELSRKVTQYKGNIYFIVCAVKADSNGNITNEWNTTLAEGKVLEGLEVETNQEQQYQASDYLEQLKQQLLEYSKEIKDTFPSDYTQIQNDIDSLKEDIANSKKAIAELNDKKITKFYANNLGETTLKDSDNGKIQDMILYGKSLQDGTPTPGNPIEIQSVVNPKLEICGKNLVNKIIETVEMYGVTFTNNGDGTYTLNGTNTSDWNAYNILEIKFNKNKTIRITGGNGYARVTLWDSKHNKFAAESFGSNPNVTVTLEPFIEYTLAILIRDLTTFDNVVIKPMISTVITDTYDDFEPYKGNKYTLPYTLNAIPVSSGGNVTIDGQEYIADYVDVERGKLVRMVDSSKLDNTQSIVNKTEWLLAEPQEVDLTPEKAQMLRDLATNYPTTNVFVTSDQLDGYTEFNYPVSLAEGWNYIKQQFGDTRDYIYDMDLQSAEAYVNSEYAVALAELEV